MVVDGRVVVVGMVVVVVDGRVVVVVVVDDVGRTKTSSMIDPAQPGVVLANDTLVAEPTAPTNVRTCCSAAALRVRSLPPIATDAELLSTKRGLAGGLDVLPRSMEQAHSPIDVLFVGPAGFPGRRDRVADVALLDRCGLVVRRGDLPAVGVDAALHASVFLIMQHVDPPELSVAKLWSEAEERPPHGPPATPATNGGERSGHYVQKGIYFLAIELPRPSGVGPSHPLDPTRPIYSGSRLRASERGPDGR